MTIANPTAAMLVIGDEILSGRTRDANMHFLAGELTRIGIDLKEVRIVSDDRPAIIAAVKAEVTAAGLDAEAIQAYIAEQMAAN